MGIGKTWGIITDRDAKLNGRSDEEREEVKREGTTESWFV